MLGIFLAWLLSFAGQLESGVPSVHGMCTYRRQVQGWALWVGSRCQAHPCRVMAMSAAYLACHVTDSPTASLQAVGAGVGTGAVAVVVAGMQRGSPRWRCPRRTSTLRQPLPSSTRTTWSRWATGLHDSAILDILICRLLAPHPKKLF